MEDEMRYQIESFNQGPFKMYQVLDTKYNPAKCLKTFKDKDDANNYIQQEIENNNWNAANRD